MRRIAPTTEARSVGSGSTAAGVRRSSRFRRSRAGLRPAARQGNAPRREWAATPISPAICDPERGSGPHQRRSRSVRPPGRFRLGPMRGKALSGKSPIPRQALAPQLLCWKTCVLRARMLRWSDRTVRKASNRGAPVVTKTSAGAGWQRAMITLTGTVVGVVVIATLYWAQSVFIPVALAGFLTFLLSPLVTWFRQRGLPRTPAVIAGRPAARRPSWAASAGWSPTRSAACSRSCPSTARTVKDKVQSLKQATGELERAPEDDHGDQPGARGSTAPPRRGQAGAGERSPAVQCRAGGDDAERTGPVRDAARRSPPAPPWSSSRRARSGCRG